MYVACKAALGAPPFFLDNPPEMLLVTLVRGIVTILTILRVSSVSIVVDAPCQIRWLDRPISTLAPYILGIVVILTQIVAILTNGLVAS
jgi:hypothetical protein